jgi:hypothetical protein
VIETAFGVPQLSGNHFSALPMLDSKALGHPGRKQHIRGFRSCFLSHKEPYRPEANLIIRHDSVGVMLADGDLIDADGLASSFSRLPSWELMYCFSKR